MIWLYVVYLWQGEAKAERVKITWTELADDAEISEGLSSDDDDDEENEDTGNATEDENDQLEDDPLTQQSSEVMSDEECNFDVEIAEEQPSGVVCEAGDQLPVEPSPWTGFKMLGDNVDKNVRPSYQRSDRQTESLHYFHVLAVSDRIDFPSLSDIAPQNVVIDPYLLLLTAADIDALMEELQVLIRRYVHVSQHS